MFSLSFFFLTQYFFMMDLKSCKIHIYPCKGVTLYLKALFSLQCNAGEEIVKKKYAMAVKAIHSGVVDETKAICKAITIDCQ